MKVCRGGEIGIRARLRTLSFNRVESSSLSRGIKERSFKKGEYYGEARSLGNV